MEEFLALLDNDGFADFVVNEYFTGQNMTNGLKKVWSATITD